MDAIPPYTWHAATALLVLACLWLLSQIPLWVYLMVALGVCSLIVLVPDHVNAITSKLYGYPFATPPPATLQLRGRR